MNMDENIYGKSVLKARLKRGFSQAELAEMFDISRNYFFVKRELKAPSTAKFVRPGEIGTRCEYQGNQRYFVRGYVDAL
jgi:hypothetical protein